MDDFTGRDGGANVQEGHMGRACQQGWCLGRQSGCRRCPCQHVAIALYTALRRWTVGKEEENFAEANRSNA